MKHIIIIFYFMIITNSIFAQETINCAKKFDMKVIPEVDECEAAEKGNTGISQGYLECVCANRKKINEKKSSEKNKEGKSSTSKINQKKKTEEEETTELYVRLNQQYNSMTGEAERLKSNGKQNTQTYRALLKRIRSTEMALNIPRHKAFNNSNFLNENTGNITLDNTSRKINDVKEASDNISRILFGGTLSENLNKSWTNPESEEQKRYWKERNLAEKKEREKRLIKEAKIRTIKNKAKRNAIIEYNKLLSELTEDKILSLINNFIKPDIEKSLKSRLLFADVYPEIYEDEIFIGIINSKPDESQYAIIYIFDKNKNLLKIVDIQPYVTSGYVSSDINFEGTELFYKKSGLATYKISSLDNDKDKYVIFNKKGEIITRKGIYKGTSDVTASIEKPEHITTQFKESHLIVQNDNYYYGLVDIQNGYDIIIPFKYFNLEVENSSYGLLEFKEKNNEYKGLININNEIIVPQQFRIIQMGYPCSEGYIQAKKKFRGSNYRYYNYLGKKVTRYEAYN